MKSLPIRIYIIVWIIGCFASRLAATEVRVRIFTYSPPAEVEIQAVIGAYDLKSSAVESQHLNPTINIQSEKGKFVVRCENSRLLVRFQSPPPGLRTRTLVADTLSLQSHPLPNQRDTNPLFRVASAKTTRLYHGQLLITCPKNQLQLINVVDSADYLDGVIPAEMPATSPLAALQAQAIVARSYALANQHRHEDNGYDYCDLTHCQVYQGATMATQSTDRVRSERCLKAIVTTAEMVLISDNRIIETFYTANCGGRTAITRELWGFDSPLVSVKDERCAKSDANQWRYEMAISDLHALLQADERSSIQSDITSVRVKETGPSGRVIRVEIVGATRREISGFTFWSILAARLKWGHVRSTYFTLQRDHDRYTFIGRGLGHGVGFCQDGAIKYAEMGASYQNILKFYFPNLHLAKAAAMRSTGVGE